MADLLYIHTFALPAYIDGGSGSMLFQVLIAGLLGIGVTIRAYWGGILGFFSRMRRGRDA